MLYAGKLFPSFLKPTTLAKRVGALFTQQETPQIPTPSFRAELQTSLIPSIAANGTPTFTRALAAYAPDYEGRLVLAPDRKSTRLNSSH